MLALATSAYQQVAVQISMLIRTLVSACHYACRGWGYAPRPCANQRIGRTLYLLMLVVVRAAYIDGSRVAVGAGTGPANLDYLGASLTAEDPFQELF